MNEETFIVQRIKTMDRLVSKPLGYETEAIEGLTIQNFQLVTVKSQKSERAMLELPHDVQQFKTLTYSYEEENAPRGSHMTQPDLRNDNIPLVMEVEKNVAIKEANRLLMEIVRELENNEYYADPSGKFVADKMDMLRKAISNLEYSDLSSFVSKHMEDSEKWSPIK